MTEKYKVVYSEEAKDDILSIRRYIANKLKAPTTATNLTNRIRESIKKLDMLPERFIRVEWEPWRSMNMRHYPVGNYEVYYIVDNENSVVTVERIFYGGQDIESILLNQSDIKE